MQDVFWNGFADELEKFAGPGLTPNWYTEPIADKAMKAVAGHTPSGGVVTPGGSTSTRKLPPAKGKDIAVSDDGAVVYTPSRAAAR